MEGVGRSAARSGRTVRGGTVWRRQARRHDTGTPGPGSPVAATCDADAVNEHVFQCIKPETPRDPAAATPSMPTWSCSDCISRSFVPRRSGIWRIGSEAGVAAHFATACSPTTGRCDGKPGTSWPRRGQFLLPDPQVRQAPDACRTRCLGGIDDGAMRKHLPGPAALPTGQTSFGKAV